MTLIEQIFDKCTLKLGVGHKSLARGRKSLIKWKFTRVIAQNATQRTSWQTGEVWITRLLPVVEDMMIRNGTSWNPPSDELKIVKSITELVSDRWAIHDRAPIDCLAGFHQTDQIITTTFSELSSSYKQ